VCSIFQCYYIILPVGFRRKEFRGKLAIAITANFINRNTTAEAKVEEISGVAFIFNQKFFQDLREATGLPAIARFPVKTICRYYYNFVTQVSCMNILCKEASHCYLSLNSYFPIFSCSIQLYKADAYHSDVKLFRGGELTSLKVFEEICALNKKTLNSEFSFLRSTSECKLQSDDKCFLKRGSYMQVNVLFVVLLKIHILKSSKP